MPKRLERVADDGVGVQIPPSAIGAPVSSDQEETHRTKISQILVCFWGPLQPREEDGHMDKEELQMMVSERKQLEPESVDTKVMPFKPHLAVLFADWLANTAEFWGGPVLFVVVHLVTATVVSCFAL